MAQLEQLSARLHSSLLDRSRPLWEIYVIEGLENGQVAYYSKVHHSGIDGKSGTELAKVFYDVTPEIREMRRRAATRRGGQYQLGVTEMLEAAVSNSAPAISQAGEYVAESRKSVAAAATVDASQRRPAANALECRPRSEDDLQ